MTPRLIKNSLGLFAWSAAEVLFALLTLSLVAANYLACLSSFMLLGFDTKPLANDEMLGTFFAVFAPQATLAHLYALVMAATMAVGLFFAFHTASQLLEFTKQRRLAVADGDARSAEAWKWHMAEHGLLLALISIPLFCAVIWDVELFRFRSIAGAQQIDSVIAATELPHWGILKERLGTRFMFTLTGWGAWGYLAMTAISCLILAWGFKKMREYFTLLSGLLEEQPGQSGGGSEEVYEPLFEGPQETEQPLPELELPMASEEAESPADDRRSAAPGSGRARSARARRRAAGEGSGRGAPSANERRGVLEEHPPARSCPAEPAPSAAPGDPDGLRPVIGSPTGEQVSPAAALRHPGRYHVDTATGQVWDRGYWDQLQHASAEGQSKGGTT